MELDQFAARLLELGRTVGGGGVAELVEAFEFLDGLGQKRLFVDPALVSVDELAELRAPVAEMVVANHFGPGEGEEPADCLADDGGAEVADMHLLGRVGGGVVDHPGLAGVGVGGAGPQMPLGIVGLEPAKQGGRLKAEVDEARTSQRYVKVLPQNLQGINQLLGHGTGVLLFALGEGEGAVGLEISMRRVGHTHLRVETTLGQTELGGGGPEGGVEVGGDVERKVHQLIEELRLALSKKHFRWFSGSGNKGL